MATLNPKSYHVIHGSSKPPPAPMRKHTPIMQCNSPARNYTKIQFKSQAKVSFPLKTYPNFDVLPDAGLVVHWSVTTITWPVLSLSANTRSHQWYTIVVFNCNKQPYTGNTTSNFNGQLVTLEYYDKQSKIRWTKSTAKSKWHTQSNKTHNLTQHNII